MKTLTTFILISIVGVLLYGLYACYFEMLFIFEWIDLLIIPMSLGLIVFFVILTHYVWKNDFKL